MGLARPHIPRRPRCLITNNGIPSGVGARTYSMMFLCICILVSIVSLCILFHQQTKVCKVKPSPAKRARLKLSFHIVKPSHCNLTPANSGQNMFDEKAKPQSVQSSLMPLNSWSPK
eukprot:3022236-Amphidinium_carterae.1